MLNDKRELPVTLDGADLGAATRDSMPGVREVLTVLFKHQMAIVLTFALVTGLATAITLLLPPTYRSESKLLVKFGRENIYRSEVGDDKSQVLTANSEEILNSEANILTSRDLIARVVSTLTVDRIYPSLAGTAPRHGTPFDLAVEKFGRDLTVEGIRKSSVIQLSLLHQDPQIAATALGLLVDYFKEKHLQTYSDPKSSYLEQQLASYEQRLTHSQSELEAFKQRNHVYSIDEQRTLLLRQRNDLDTAFKATQNEIKEAQQQIVALQASLQTVSPDVPLSTDTERYRSVDDAKSQLLALQLKERDLLRRYTESNELVVGVRGEIQIVERFIKDQERDIKGRMRTGQNVVYQDLERQLLKQQSQLPSLEAKAASLRGQIAQLNVNIPQLDATESGLENLKRDVSVNDRNYRTYREKVEEALTLEDLNRQKSANISVIQEATIPVRPVRPQKALNIAVGALLGIVAGLGVAFLRELSAQGLPTPEAAEQRLGVPVLTSVALKG